MSSEMRIELHRRSCSCRGGSWVLLESTSASPCSGPAAAGAEKLVIDFIEWKQLGKPGSIEAFKEARERTDAGERRQYQRYEVSLPVSLGRIPTWRDPSAQNEDTLAEVIATGGALVRSRMAVEKGEMVRFVLQSYVTRAEVTYVSAGFGPGMDGIQRLGLKFLDAPLPEELIPKNARPLPQP
jgi:hypothetical protein